MRGVGYNRIISSDVLDSLGLVLLFVSSPYQVYEPTAYTTISVRCVAKHELKGSSDSRTFNWKLNNVV